MDDVTADRENRLGLGLATEEKRSKNVTGRRMGGLEMRSLAGSPVAPEFIKTSGADHRSADLPFSLSLFHRTLGGKARAWCEPGKRGKLSSFLRKTKLIERESKFLLSFFREKHFSKRFLL